jgi:hypothetical protein
MEARAGVYLTAIAWPAPAQPGVQRCGRSANDPKAAAVTRSKIIWNRSAPLSVCIPKWRCHDTPDSLGGTQSRW